MSTNETFEFSGYSAAGGPNQVVSASTSPGSLAIISASFSQEQRGRAIGTWSGFTAITSAVGPVLGGFLVDHASWRWVFFINLPVALTALGITLWRVPESRDQEAVGLDWPGAIACTLGLGGVVFGLIESTTLGWTHPVVFATAAGGVAALIAFVMIEGRSPAPMMPLGLFRSRTFTGANILTLLLYAALTGALFFVPFDLIQVHGYSATAAGASFVPYIVIMFLLSRWSGGLVTRYSAKLPLVIGPVVAAIGFALFAVPGVGGSYWTTFFPAAVVLGLGLAVSVAPLSTAVMGVVDAGHVGLASGINNAVARIAGLLAIGVMGVVLLFAFSRVLDAQLAPLYLSSSDRQVLDAQRVQLAAMPVPTDVREAEGREIRRAIDESFVAGFRLVSLLAAGLALASALSAWLMVESQTKAKPEQDSHPTLPTTIAGRFRPSQRRRYEHPVAR